jgi:hypothetical protein
LTASLALHFSHHLAGIAWKTLADPQEHVVYIEIRNPATRTVSFSGIDLASNTWRFQNISFEEKWWISLTAVSSGIILFTIYNDSQNPDKKSVLAYSIKAKEVVWWKNNFVISFVGHDYVTGVDMKFGTKEAVLDILTGESKGREMLVPSLQNFSIIHPLVYQESNPHFDTVKTFLNAKTDVSARFSVEYCEHQALIFISAFAGESDLANYLFVFNSDGQMVLKETLGMGLKGIAHDTFFLMGGFLIFVKNKSELVSYKVL